MNIYKYNPELNSKFNNSNYLAIDKKIYTDETRKWWTNKHIIALINHKTPTGFDDEAMPVESVLSSIKNQDNLEIKIMYSLIDDLNTVVLKHDDLSPVFIQSRYVSYFESYYKNPTYMAGSNEKMPISVWFEGQLVGCISRVDCGHSFEQLDELYKQQNEGTIDFADKVFLKDVKSLKCSLGTMKDNFAVHYGTPYASDLQQIIFSEIELMPDGTYTITDELKIKRIHDSSDYYLNLTEDLCARMPVFAAGNTIEKQIKKAENKGEFTVINAPETEIKVKGSVFGDYGVYELLTDKGEKRFQVVYIPMKQQVIPFHKLSFAKAIAYRCSLEKEPEEKTIGFLYDIIRPIVIRAQSIQFGKEPVEYVFSRDYKPACFQTVKDVFKGVK